MKIIYVVSTLKACGPTNQLYNIIANRKAGVSSTLIVTLSPESSESYKERFDNLGVRIIELGLSRLEGYFWGLKRLRDIIVSERPEVIHSQGIRADILISKLKLKIPVMCTVRNIPQIDYLMTYGRVMSFFMLGRHRSAMKKMDVCVGVSDAVSDNLINFTKGSTEIITIRNGVDTSRYFPATCEEKKRLRLRLSLPIEHRVWISSGHLTERKDPEFIIRAFNIAFGNSGIDTLIFIGDGDLRSGLAEKYACKNNIVFLGRVDKVADYLRASDFYMSSSVAEGLPNAVIEGLACGLPVILSDIGPHEEIYALDKRCGELFRLSSLEDAVDRMLAIASADHDALSLAALDIANGVLSARTMSESYDRVYEKLTR